MARSADRPWYRKERDTWYTTLGGKQVRLAKGKGNRKVAEKELLKLKLAQHASPSVASERQTVQSILGAYLKHAKRHLSARHFAHQQSILQRFNDAHGYRDVADCRPIHLTQWLDANPDWKTDWTLHGIVSTVKRAFTCAATQELITKNPFKVVKRPTGAPRRPVTDDEFQRLLRGAGGPTGKTFRQALVFMRFTGCRPGEMAALKWEDLDLDRARIVLSAHKTARKTHKPRVLPMMRAVVKLLTYRRKQTDGPYVFLNAYGNPWHRSALSLRLQRCRARQDIPKEATLYGVRHKFGTDAIIKGVDLKSLSMLMGHTTTRMTEYYLHLAGEDAHLEQSMRRATGPRPDIPTSQTGG